MHGHSVAFVRDSARLTHFASTHRIKAAWLPHGESYTCVIYVDAIAGIAGCVLAIRGEPAPPAGGAPSRCVAKCPPLFPLPPFVQFRSIRFAKCDDKGKGETSET